MIGAFWRAVADCPGDFCVGGIDPRHAGGVRMSDSSVAGDKRRSSRRTSVRVIARKYVRHALRGESASKIGQQHRNALPSEDATHAEVMALPRLAS
jgi:hypothetical protein